MSKLISKQLVGFVKGFEGFSAVPYKDEVDVLTLGYGMIGDEIAGINYVTEQQATEMLEDLLNNKYAIPIKNSLDSKGVTLNQNQFDALVSMSYNIGTGGVLCSTLYRNICNGIRDNATITANFTAWSKAGGNVLPGLLRRRQEEAAMFFETGNIIDNSNSDTLITNVKDPTKIQQIKALQYDLNVDYNAKLTNTDGNVYQSTLDALNGIKGAIVKGHKSKVVQWVQQKLIKYGFLGKGQDTGVYDEPTFQAVTNLQKAWGKPTDGVLRIETWNIFLDN